MRRVGVWSALQPWRPWPGTPRLYIERAARGRRLGTRAGEGDGDGRQVRGNRRGGVCLVGVGGGASARAFRNPDSTCTRVRIPCRVRALSPWMGSRWFARRRGVVAWWGLGGLPGWGFRLGTRRHGGHLGAAASRKDGPLACHLQGAPRRACARLGRVAVRCTAPYPVLGLRTLHSAPPASTVTECLLGRPLGDFGSMRHLVRRCQMYNMFFRVC